MLAGKNISILQKLKSKKLLRIMVAEVMRLLFAGVKPEKAKAAAIAEGPHGSHLQNRSKSLYWK